MTFAAWLATPLGDYLRAARAGVLRSRRSPISSASTRCRSACRNVRSSRKAASSRNGRSTTTRRPTSSPIRTGCRSRENTIDLIVMPHALEFTDDPHLMLREAWRVIRPEGQIVISGFNPFSLFGTQALFRPRRDAAVERQLHRAVPAEGLAGAARLRRRRRPLRLLRAAVHAGEMAAALLVLREDRRSLVADHRRRLLPASDEEGARHARCSRRRGSAASAARRRWRRRARACAKGLRSQRRAHRQHAA